MNKNSLALIFKFENTYSAIIAFKETSEKNCYEISINLSPKDRRQNKGSIYLKLAENYLKKKFKAVSIVAVVLNKNIISYNFFIKNNYSIVKSNQTETTLIRFL